MPKGKLKVSDKEWKTVKRRLTTKQTQTQVGWFNVFYPEENDYLPVAQVAKWNEEGHANGGLFSGTRTPPRPFLRTTFIYGIELYLQDFANIFAAAVADGRMTWHEVGNKIGENAKDILQDVIDIKNAPPNSKTTVEMKGFNNPLIEAGYMRDTISWQIKGKRKRAV